MFYRVPAGQGICLIPEHREGERGPSLSPHHRDAPRGARTLSTEQAGVIFNSCLQWTPSE